MGKRDALIIAGCCLLLTVLICGGLKMFLIFSDNTNNIEGNITNPTNLTNNNRTNRDGGGIYTNNLPANQKQTVHFLFFGDIMLDRHVGERIEANGFDYLFDDLTATTTPEEMSGKRMDFTGYDIVSANLEGAVTDNGAHYAPVMAYDFAFSPDLVGELEKYNFNFFNIANNHLSDQGERGIIETRKNLDNLGFAYAGCRDAETGECSSRVIEAGGKKIGMAGFSMVYHMLGTEAAAGIVDGLASTTDAVIVNIHWGREYEHEFDKAQRETAHTLIDAGADIVIGHHPHVVEGMEIYHGKPIFYSLGNFIFDQYFSADTQEGLAIGADLDAGGVAITLMPFTSKNGRPRLETGEEKDAFLKKFAGWSSIDEKMANEVFSGGIKLKRK